MDELYEEMDDPIEGIDAVIESLSYFGGIIRGKPPVLSPVLDDLEILQYIQQPLKPVSDSFRILLHLGPIKREDVVVTVPTRGAVQIAIQHDRKQNSAGLWLKQRSYYTIELPDELRKKELHAEWSDDNYLLVQPVSSGTVAKSYYWNTVLIPQRVHRLLKPVSEIPVLKKMLEEIRNKVNVALRYIHFVTSKPIGETLPETAGKEGLSPEDISKLEEARSKRMFGDPSTSEDCKHMDSRGKGVAPSEGMEESSTSYQEPMGKLVEIFSIGKSAGSVEEQVVQILRSLDRENSQASIIENYSRVIVLLMQEWLAREGIASQNVELRRSTDEGNSDLTMLSTSTATLDEPKDLSEESKQATAVSQAAPSVASAVKPKESVDKRRHTEPIVTKPHPSDSGEEFEGCPSPEKKRKL